METSNFDYCNITTGSQICNDGLSICLSSGLPLRNNGRYTLLLAGGMLRILQVVSSDQGQFTCRAENAAGSITASARLRIVDNG